MYQIQIFGLYFWWIVIMPGLQTTKRLSVFGGLRECHQDSRKWMRVWNRYSLVLINPVLVIWPFIVVYMAYFVWGSMNERKLALRYWGTTCDSIVQEFMELRTMKQGNFNGASRETSMEQVYFFFSVIGCLLLEQSCNMLLQLQCKPETSVWFMFYHIM